MAKQLSLDVNPIDLREPLLTAAQAASSSRSAPPGSLTPPAAATSRCVRIGKHVRFLRSDLERWAGEQRARP
jgi:hypothetical protein